MITQDQALQLAAEGAQCLLREQGQLRVESMTLLEFLTAAHLMSGKALDSGEAGYIWRDGGQRHPAFLRLAGLILLALQQHGDSLFTTHQLHRSLHATKADQKSLLLESQFLRGEAKDAFTACHDAAKTSEFFDEEPWRKLKGTLERLGVQF